jgi:hypothetical protein
MAIHATSMQILVRCMHGCWRRLVSSIGDVHLSVHCWMDCHCVRICCASQHHRLRGDAMLELTVEILVPRVVRVRIEVLLIRVDLRTGVCVIWTGRSN